MKNSTEHVQLNEKKWDKRSKTYDLKVFDYFRYLQKKVVDQMNILPNQNFLDVGCGTGWAVNYLAKKLHHQGKFFGVDISEKMLYKARQKLNGSINIDLIKSSCDNLPFENNFFDFIVCTNSFHHYPDPQKTILEFNRVLKPNGQLYILDVTRDNFLAQTLNQYFRITEKEHVKFHSTKEFVKMFALAGLSYCSGTQLVYIFKIHCGIKSQTLNTTTIP